MTGAQIERIRAKERLTRQAMLNEEDYDEFQDLLRDLTLSRRPIKVAMGFAYDKVESSEDIANMLKQSLLVAETPPPTRMARLYLISDILHNSGAPIKNASSYRYESTINT
jgi:U2-associated protein SR140